MNNDTSDVCKAFKNFTARVLIDVLTERRRRRRRIRRNRLTLKSPSKNMKRNN